MFFQPSGQDINSSDWHCHRYSSCKLINCPAMKLTLFRIYKKSASFKMSYKLWHRISCPDLHQHIGQCLRVFIRRRMEYESMPVVIIILHVIQRYVFPFDHCSKLKNKIQLELQRINKSTQ